LEGLFSPLHSDLIPKDEKMQIQTACAIIGAEEFWAERVKNYFCVGAIFLSAIFFTGCAASDAVSATPTRVSFIANEQTPTPSARATATLRAPTATPLAPTSAITLTLWTAEEFAPGATPAGQVLRAQFDAFTAANPNIRIEVVLKKPYGKGGLLDFLLTTAAIAPTRVPDLIALDLAEAQHAASILQPLDAWLAAESQNDLFPFAQNAARPQNQWLVVPFAADVQHLVYDRNLVPTPPRTWDDALKQKQTLLMPLGGDDAFVLQYGALTGLDAGFEFGATAQVLNFFKRAHDLGIVPDAAIGIKNASETWSPFAANQVAMTQVFASRYLAERDKLPNAQYASIPTRDGRTATLATGWGWAITARDPMRQAAAARLIQWLTQSDRLVTYLRAARRLPAQRAALGLVVESYGYAIFLREQLDRAIFPSAATYAKSAEVWRVAIPAVWSGQMTPEDAARTIAAVAK
jgi:ABC-type glycerol-3-phosphate transport system substrate-binding protein